MCVCVLFVFICKVVKKYFIVMKIMLKKEIHFLHAKHNFFSFSLEFVVNISYLNTNSINNKNMTIIIFMTFHYCKVEQILF